VAGSDNGKISSVQNGVSGETVTYLYDSLNRLSSDTLLPGMLKPNGANYSFSDAPGLDETSDQITSAQLNFNLVLNVSFSTGGSVIQCDPIQWSAWVNWPLFGQPTGGVTIGGN